MTNDTDTNTNEAKPKDTFNTLSEYFADENKARELLEQIRWGEDGVTCPHCEGKEAYKLTAKEGSKSPVRKGVYKCKSCRKQFTVKVGTIFEDSHIPLNKWLYALHLMCSSKKGVSAHQLHRTLGITYKSAWYMAHRIRYAMSQNPLASKLGGIIEVDETYVGGKPRKGEPKSKRGRGTKKTPVVAVVQRDGEVRAKKIVNVTGKTLKKHIRENVASEAKIMTDSYTAYSGLSREFEHQTVDHNTKEFMRIEVMNGESVKVHTNTAESWFSLLKRGVHGTFHHVSTKHLDRYVDEFTFRWNNRKISDVERLYIAVGRVGGKRLMYRRVVAD